MDVWSTCETAAQLFARLSSRPCLDDIEQKLFRRNKTKFVEILGGEGSGKTELLLCLIVNTIIPKQWNGIELGGIGSCVLFIDTDYKFPFIRFISLIEQRLICKCLTKIDNRNISDIDTGEFVKSCLRNFYKVNCSSMLQINETLKSLQSFLGDNPDTILILIDNITTYYWSEKFHSKQDVYNHVEAFNQLIKDLVDVNNLSVVVTRNQLEESTNHNYEKFASLTKVGSIRYVIKKEQGKKLFLDLVSGVLVISFSISNSGIAFL